MTQILFEFLMQNTIWSFLTCGLVLLVAPIFRRRPAALHLACVLALIAMLTPPLFSISIPLSNWIATNRLDSIATGQAVSEENDPAPIHKLANDNSVMKVAVNGPLESGAPTRSIWEKADSRQSASSRSLVQIDWCTFIMAVWLSGSVWIFVYMVRQTIRFHQLVARAMPAKSNLELIVNSEANQLGLRRTPIVRELCAIVSPFVFLSAQGPQLVMPSALVTKLSSKELRSLILHELAHLKRHDPVVRILELAVTTIFWFNPAMWLICNRLRQAEELSCDAVVVNSLNGQTAIYGKAFLKTIDFLSGDRIETPSTICAVGGYRSCQKRLRAMVQATNLVGVSRIQRLAVALTAIPILFVGVQTAPVYISKDANNSRRDISIASVLDDQLTDLDLNVIKQLSEKKETPEIVFHYRPNEFSENELSRAVDVNLNRFAETQRLLQMKYNGRVHVFLYRDIDDLQQSTGVPATAFSTGTASVHQPIDFDSVHELVHIFALQFPSDDDAVTDNFVVEGLATTLAQHDENIPIHTWAAVYLSTARIPNLIELRKSWPNGVLPHVHPYHVAGSFVGYLIENFGIEKVKRWYVNSTEANMEFGKTLRRLEKEWRSWLKQQTVSPDHKKFILAKLQLSPMPDAHVAGEKVQLFDGKTMSGWHSDDAANWKAEGGRLVGRNAGGWTFINSKQKFPEDVGARVKFRMAEGKAISIRLNCMEDSSNHVNMATWGTYVSFVDGGYIGLPNLKLEPGGGKNRGHSGKNRGHSMIGEKNRGKKTGDTQ